MEFPFLWCKVQRVQLLHHILILYPTRFAPFVVGVTGMSLSVFSTYTTFYFLHLHGQGLRESTTFYMYGLLPQFLQLRRGNAVGWSFFIVIVISESSFVDIKPYGIARKEKDRPSIKLMSQRIADVPYESERMCDGVSGHFRKIFTLQRFFVPPETGHFVLIAFFPVHIPPQDNGRSTLSLPHRKVRRRL